MKKVLLVLSIAVLILALTGCPGWFPPSQQGNGQEILDAYPIQPVLDSRDATDNDIVAKVAGIITYLYKDYIVIQNGSAGIKVFKFGAFSTTDLEEGDVVTAEGTVTYYKDNYEMLINGSSDVTYIDEDFEPVIQDFPIDTTLDATTGPEYNYELVRLTDVTVAASADAYHNVVVTNGTGTVTIYSFDNDVREWLDSLELGDTIEEVVGYVEQNYGWKVVIRDSNDYSD